MRLQLCGVPWSPLGYQMNPKFETIKIVRMDWKGKLRGTSRGRLPYCLLGNRKEKFNKNASPLSFFSTLLFPFHTYAHSLSANTWYKALTRSQILSSSLSGIIIQKEKKKTIKIRRLVSFLSPPKTWYSIGDNNNNDWNLINSFPIHSLH